MYKKEKHEGNAVDLMWGGIVSATLGIVLFNLYRASIWLIIAGIFAIVISGWIMAKKNLK